MNLIPQTVAAFLAGFALAAVAVPVSAQDIVSALAADPALKAKLPPEIAAGGKLTIAGFPNPPFNLEQEDKTVVGASYDLGARDCTRA
jgi:hypothetical protein